MSSNPLSQTLAYDPSKDLALEKAILGACILEADAFNRVSWFMPEYFASEEHAQIWAVIREMKATGLGVDIATVYRHAKKTGHNISPVTITKLTNSVASSANLEYHAGYVWEAYTRRQGKRLLEERFAEMKDPSNDVPGIIEGATTDLLNLLRRADVRDGRKKETILKEWEQRMHRVCDAKGQIVGIPTGIRTLDHITGGFMPGEVDVWAAETGHGKTDVSLYTLLQAARNGHACEYIGLEMSDLNLVNRLMSMITGLNKNVFRRGNDQYLRDHRGAFRPNIIEALEEIKRLPLTLSDMGTCDSNGIRRKMIEAARNGAKLVAVDYLQLIESAERNRSEGLEKISRTIKMTAKDTQLAVILLAQFSRSVSTRAERRPQLSDLHGSSAIEKDADRVLFLYRPEKAGVEYFEDGASTEGVMEIIPAKYREGDTEPQHVQYDSSRGVIRDLDATHELAPPSMAAQPNGGNAPF